MSGKALNLSLVGPSSLREALEAAEPGPNGCRMAVSSPNGDLVAFQFRTGGPIRIRRVETMSGRAGSQMGTGRWLTEAECHVNSWRPA